MLGVVFSNLVLKISPHSSDSRIYDIRIVLILQDFARVIKFNLIF